MSKEPRYLGFNAERVCAAESNARGFGGTPHNTLATVDTGPRRCRANLTPLDRTEDLGKEQIPGLPQVGGRYFRL